jgi:outer membrane receptor for ferric coprogen and ferric-rhodotorulic acid
MRIVQCLFASTAILAAWAGTAHAADESDAEGQLRGDIVVSATIKRESAAATGLPLTLRETPQSVTVIDRDRIEDFALTNVNDLLSQVVGINVERTETDRTEYNARGFDITNFQVDGIGLPLRWGIQFGDMDTILYDRVEAVRGANAIMSGIGNPSATINYVRKRPTEDFRASAALQLGSWDQWRAEADISGPLDAAGAISARLIYAHDDRDTYLNHNHVNRDVFGGMVAWKITPELTATAGYTRQENDSDGVLWGALPLLYSDGTRIPYAVSASTSAEWTFWNVHDDSAYAELAYLAEGGWQAKGRFTYNRRSSRATLLYAYGYPDRQTGLGIGGMTGIYRSPSHQYLGDLYASGPVKLFGREHSLAFGLSMASMKSNEYEAFSNTFPEYPSVSEWAQNGLDLAQPAYPEEYLAEDTRDKLTRTYGAFHANLTDSLKAVVGVSAIGLRTTGSSYGADQSRKNSRISPYAGTVFDVTPNVSLYASYTDIYNPQKEVDVTNRRLDPAKGTNIEGGIKSEWLDRKLYASVAVFRARQQGLAEAAGVFAPGDAGPAGDVYYVGVDTTAKGFEIELTGHVTDRWAISGGYTGLRIRDQNGNATRTYLPTKTMKLATTYAIPALRDLKLGAQFRWQSGISIEDAGVVDYGIVSDPVTIRQKGYGVLDLMASIAVIDHVRASVNIRNVTDTKYLGSLKWGQAFYAAPRSVLVTLGVAY